MLAVFTRLGADPNLFALVLGESLMNDAVAMVSWSCVLWKRPQQAHAQARRLHALAVQAAPAAS